MSEIFQCPHCGADVPIGAAACPVCGSDEETGWSDEAIYGTHSYEDIGPADARTTSIPWNRYLIATVAAVTLTAFLTSLHRSAVYLAIPLLLLAISTTYYLTTRAPAGRSQQEQQLYRRLLTRARGDEALVERLIEYERQRDPDGGRSHWLQDAIDRWDRDAR